MTDLSRYYQIIFLQTVVTLLFPTKERKNDQNNSDCFLSLLCYHTVPEQIPKLFKIKEIEIYFYNPKIVVTLLVFP